MRKLLAGPDTPFLEGGTPGREIGIEVEATCRAWTGNAQSRERSVELTSDIPVDECRAMHVLLDCSMGGEGDKSRFLERRGGRRPDFTCQSAQGLHDLFARRRLGKRRVAESPPASREGFGEPASDNTALRIEMGR